MTRVLVMLLLVGGMAVHLRAQTLPQPGLTPSDDAVLRGSESRWVSRIGPVGAAPAT